MQQWSAVQGAAIMILLRLTAFFCCGAPYSAAKAKGMLAAAAIQAVLAGILLHFRQYIPRVILIFLRIFALFWAIWLVLLTARLYELLRLGKPAVIVLMLVILLLYTVPQRSTATARTATILLCVVALSFLLLPVSGYHTALRILLYMPDSAAAAFRREWLYSGELLLLPLIWQRQTRQAARRSTLAWSAFRCIFLPALVLFGAMQNGRLTQFQGSPFFLLLARTPLSDAMRTDGLWMLYAFGCGALSITFCLQQIFHSPKEQT